MTPKNDLVPIKNSIAIHLLKIIFGIYVLIAVLLTVVHMIAEFQDTKNTVIKELNLMHQTFAPGLGTSLWDGYGEQVQSILQGMVKTPIIEGVEVVNDLGERFSYGMVLNKHHTPVIFDDDGNETKVSGSNISAFGLFYRKYPIHYAGEDSETDKMVGYLTLFSSSKVVFNKVKLGFFLIIVTSILKTLALWIIFLWIVRRRLVIPLAILTDATRKLDYDNLESIHIDVKTTGRNELKVLEEAFNDMARKMEMRVEERTAELTQLNVDLQKAKDEAYAATQAKSIFLANMSHEIRTPMNGVIAATDLALQQRQSPETERYLQIIRSSGRSLLNIINDILDFSKIEAGKLDLEHAPIDVNAVIENISNVFIKKIEEKAIELVLDIDPLANLYVLGDALRLQQVITNLVSNALKFTPQGGTITIGVGRGSLEGDAKRTQIDSLNENQSLLKFFVRDTGIGISPENLKRLFNPFTQADVSTTRNYGGTGLGLTICKQLVGLMGGEIWAESVPDRGTTFHFYAVFQKRFDKPQRIPPVPEDLKSKHILIVDDNPVCQTSIMKILNALGYTYECVSLGIECIHRLKKDGAKAPSFDCIILDWLMPEINGLETAKMIKHQLQLNIPMIMATGFGNETEKKEAQQSGIQVFLTKPITAKSFFNAIMKVFDRNDQVISQLSPSKASQSVANKESLKGKNILVAEDNITNQEIAIAILTKAEINVDIANTGKEAVDAVFSKPYDAVLMDMQMPEMDGYEATRKIRAHGAYQKLPIIAMTAHALKSDEQKCLAAGMNAYIPKPIHQADLFKTLAGFLSPLRANSLSVSTDEEECPTSEEPEQTEKKASLADLKEIQYQKAMNDMGLDQETYILILKSFYESSQDLLGRLGEAHKANQRLLIKELAHSIKGSSANIGALKLKEVAETLEQSCQEMVVLDAGLIAHLAAELKSVLASIKPVIQNNPLNSP